MSEEDSGDIRSCPRAAMYLLALLFVGCAYGKTYDRCELARELRYVQEAPEEDVATWVCIAEHESQYNTSAVGSRNADGSNDHGIFQISDKFWCSTSGRGLACNLNCSELEDDDIDDDFDCARKVHKEHKFLSGDGFNAWAVYEPFCKGARVEKYTKDCFNATDLTTHPPFKKKKTTTKKTWPWLVPRPSTTTTTTDEPQRASACDPSKVGPPTTESPKKPPALTNPGAFLNRVSRNDLTATAGDRGGPRPLTTTPTSGLRTDRRTTRVTPTVSTAFTREVNSLPDLKASRFIINGRVWM